MGAVEIQAPDGTVVEFPEGTPDATIVRVMQREYPAPARRPPMRNVTPRPVGYTPAAGGIAALSRGATFGAAPALEGAYQATGEAVRQLLPSAAPIPQRLRAIGDAYRRGSQEVNDYADTFSREAAAPWIGPAYEAGGGLLTGGLAQRGVAAALPALERAAGGRGLGALGAQAAQGGITGAGAGAIYSANTDGIEAAPQGALMGGLLGAAAPVGVGALRQGARLLSGPANAIASVARRVEVDPNAIGANGGNIRLRPPAPRGPQPPSGSVRRGVDLADRARLGSSDLARRASQSPEGAAVVDLFNDAGVRTLRPIVQAPGQTGDLAREVTDRRFAEAPARIVNALRQRLNVGESRAQAMQRLEQEYRSVGANQYRPIFERPLTAEQRSGLESRLAPYADDPVFSGARQRAEAIFRRDRSNGLVSGDIEDNFARWAHYLKMGLDDASKLAGNPMQSGGVGPTELRGIREMRARVIQTIDDAVPGYREARAQWAGLKEAEDALDTGAGWVKMLPEEVTAARAHMTPFELEHARIGLADEIRHMVRGQVVGNKNVANAINDPDMQQAIANAFDSPEQAAEFLDVVNNSNRLMRNASQWGGGSQTQGNQAYQADGVIGAVADFGGDMLGGRWGQAVNRAGRQIGNAALGNIVERSNNEFGRELLRPATTDEARAFVGEIGRILKHREAARAASSAASRSAALSGGVAANRRPPKP